MAALAILVCISGGFSLAAAEIRYPDAAGVVDVTKAPYFAKGDGVTDDTAAINAALKDWNRARVPELAMSHTIYFPKGVYLVSKTLVPMHPTNAMDQCSVRFLGESREQTVIQLKDKADGFGNPKAPRYVIKTGNNPEVRDGKLRAGQPNSGYGNYIQNLTVNVGNGNPGAVGIRYDVSNFGAMEHVNIVSPSGSGFSGLLFHGVCGPGYVKDVRIQGFDYGVYFDQVATNNIVFEHLSLKHQNLCGILNQGKNIQIRDLKSVNRVPAIRMKNPWAATVLVGAELASPSGSPAAALEVQDGGFLFVRDVTTSGYAAAISTAAHAPKPGVAGPDVGEWTSHDSSMARLKGAPLTLRLPIKESPEYHNNDFTQWADVCDYGATRGDPADDDAPAIQAAIDSGKEIVYFPTGQYSIATPVVVRGAVKKIDGVFSMVVKPPGNTRAEIRIADVAGDSFILENISTEAIPVIHDSPDTVVLRHKAKSGDIRCGPNASGDLFVENAGPHADVRVSNGIHAWIRQLNREVEGAVNDGATLWLLGDNIERMYNKKKEALEKKPFRTVNGGRSEILGGALDVLEYTHPETGCALYEAVDSEMSVVFAGEIRERDGTKGAWGKYILNNRSNGTETVADNDVVVVPRSGGTARFIVPPYRSPARQ